MLTNRIGNGLRIVKRATLSQKPVSFGVRSLLRTLSLFTRSPRRFNCAGTAIAAPITAKVTTETPARAKDCRKYWGKKAIETSTSATVKPEKTTVFPAEATVFITAV